ncbi:MAG: cytochrome c3 family protein, partial [Candidatus Methanoperedens sp.]|nr:cytochrome c3 family protein [Candidatus Methanoperedens sp.]
YPFYTVIPTSGAYYNNIAFPTFTDTDGDGIFNSTNDVTDTLSLATTPPLTDHLNISINITVNYNGTAYKTNVSVSFGNAGCRHDKTIGTAHGAGQHDGTVCTVCHWGYQYALGAHGPNNTIMYNDPERWTGIPPGVGDSANWDYKLGILKTGGNQTTWDNSNASFCLSCHGGPTSATVAYNIANVLDIYGTGPTDTDLNDDLIVDNNRPSCSWYQGPRNGTGGYPVCHGPQAGSNGSTKITQSQLYNIDWKGWSQTPGQSKSHNRTKATPCELCHAGGGAPGTGTGGLHMVAGLPNRTTDYSNINDQCQTCHNITDGWLNITSNGGTAVNHSSSKTQCSNCHIDNNKLDSHLVPTGVFGGAWCLNCHNLTGKSPINMKVDPAIVNITNQNYTHSSLNEKSNAENSSRICWGCHTNNSYVNVTTKGVNSTSLPVADHPTGYDTPRNCTACHYNNSAYNFSAPQNFRHTWYATDMKTTAVTSCNDCHARDEMLNAWNEAVYPPKNDSEATSHYGRNRTTFFMGLTTGAYCGYCHQNESTVFGPFSNLDNEVRSDHASQNTTPGCGDSLCHKPGRIHDDTLVVPKYNESNIATTCSACHSTANYSAHNSTLTCWDCHMGNVSNNNPTWIHPIQFIQYNGNFTGAKLTGATCYDCHKSTRVDNATLNLSGKKGPKVYNQAHSNDPINGTKWGDYWKYTPTTYEFADYQIIGGNGTINPSYPFSNIKVPSNDYMELIETRTGSGNGSTVPVNKNERQINGPPVPNWTSSTATGGTTTGVTISATQDSAKGNPAGSLKASMKTGSGAGTYYGYIWWNYSFYYKPNSTQYAYTNTSVNYNITVGSALAQTVYLNLVKPNGTVVTLATTSSTVNTGWLTLTNNSFASALDEDGSATPYKLQLYTVLQGPKTSLTYTVNYDNILLKFQEKVWNRYEIVINTTGVPVNGSSKLGMSYQVHKENTSLFIYNKTSLAYELLETLDKGVFFDYVKDIKNTHHINSSDGVTGNVNVKFVDDDKSDTDSVSDKLHIRYLYIYTDRGLQYPCEQCHSPDKHYVFPAIGSPDKFNASNKYNTTDLKNSTWCQQCHWQGASNYSGMIKEFNVTRKPPENIPPEITGNKTYGNYTQYGGKSKDGSTAYVNHSGSAYSDMSDFGCFACHGKAGDTTTSQFMHNVQVGESGNRKCIICHNATTTKFKKIDVEAVRGGMHAGLKNASANVSNTSNPIELACWACHGDGTYNSSDQHRNANAWACDKCHTNTTGKLSYSTAAMVYEHIPPGSITPEANITTRFNYTSWSCSDCHNSSINTTALTIDNETDPISARTGHYGQNRTAGKLMYNYSVPPKGNSEDCNYCHKDNSANMTKWGVNTSTTRNLSNKLSPTDHRTFVNNDCKDCHNYTATSSFTFHAVEINEGAGASGPNCKNCHDIGKSAAGKLVNFSAMNETNAIHKNLNSGAVTALDADNKKCWACHGGGSEPSAHPSNYKTPYNCTDCHNVSGTQSGKYPGWNVTEHVKAGTVSGTELFTPLAGNCYTCHNKSEMMIPAFDPDNGTGAVYGFANSGNNSTSHYGLKRSDIRSGTSTNCTYCHQNSTTAFASAMQNPTVNKSIYEHSDNGTRNVTGRACTDAGCHNTGFIHNSTLTKPAVQVFTSGRNDYCAPCHRESGISTKKVRGHNTSNISTPGMDCGYCHNVSSQGSTGGALRVHSTRLTNKTTANATCTACHRDATYVPASRIIQTHYPGTTTDKGNTSESGRTCELCHGEVAANKLHQPIIKKPNYDCQSCHLNGSKTSPYNATTARASVNAFLHDNATHAPTNQTNCERCHNTTSRQEIFHFTSYANGTSVAPGWTPWTNGTQPNCIDCHRNKTNQAPFYAVFSTSATHNTSTLDGCYKCHTDVSTYASNPKALHYVVQAPGNANCTLCHDLSGEAGKKIDVSAMNKSDSIHLNLNRNATFVKAVQPYANESKRCWACHGNGSEPGGHPTNYKNSYKCADCHVTSGSRNTNYTPNNTILLVTEHYRNGSEIKTPAAPYCTNCHNKTEMLKANSDTALSAVNPANDSVSHYGRNRSEIRSGVNTSCSYCHQNSTTAFENVMLGISNKSIYEHTDAGTRNTSAGSCTGSKCHATGFIHNSTLTKPAVQNWTQGGKDYCAPCHKASDTNATKYVYAHNTSNISNPGMDCGYCHNASSQGAVSSGALKLHTSNLTNTSTSNTTCVACHRDATYVPSSRVIKTHYPNASQGKANTSKSAWGCEECHGWSAGTKMHNQSLIKKPNYDCNACHNASGTSPYKANSTPFMNVTRHDNTSLDGANVNCNTCHNSTNRPEPFHFTNWSNGTVEAPGWTGWINGTRANCIDCHVTYNNTAPFFAEPSSYPNWHKGVYGASLNDCYQCHSNLTVLAASDSRASVEMHNVTRFINWNDCNSCHSPKYGGAPKVDNISMSATNSMHATIDGATSSNINPACKACHGGNVSIHKNATASNCTYCHITDKLKFTTKNVSEHILNGTYANTTVNTSRYQQVFCDLCHNNSLANFNDDTPGTKNATTAHYGQNKSANKLMSSGANSTDCVYCHKNTSNMAKWGVLSTSNANISNRGDHTSYSANTVCYDCHVDSKAKPSTFHADELNQGIGSSPNCIGCHDMGSGNKKVDITATNDSSNIHKNLNSGANAGSYDSANKPCWACHGNGSATAHID